VILSFLSLNVVPPESMQFLTSNWPHEILGIIVNGTDAMWKNKIQFEVDLKQYYATCSTGVTRLLPRFLSLRPPSHFNKSQHIQASFFGCNTTLSCPTGFIFARRKQFFTKPENLDKSLHSMRTFEAKSPTFTIAQTQMFCALFHNDLFVSK
jgi:hypothetical protein